MKKTILKTAVAAALGAVVSMPAQAATDTFNFNGVFTMLDSTGAALANTSITGKNVNQFQTPITGTLTFDNATGAGTGTLTPFDFFSGTAPAEAVGINMQAIGDGAGGPGTLVLGNMLFNWSGNNGIPVSIVLDAAGFFSGEMTAGGANSATPASDGTYTNPTFGYLSQGPVPIATTDFNTSFANGCVTGNCMNNGASGGLPLVTDTAANLHRTLPGVPYATGTGIGGNPMADGAFPQDNANFDVTSLTFLSHDANRTITQNCALDPNISCAPSAVPVPAAVWLFGSGLLGLVGVARRKKSV